MRVTAPLGSRREVDSGAGEGSASGASTTTGGSATGAALETGEVGAADGEVA
jgi:hypothetical protein